MLCIVSLLLVCKGILNLLFFPSVQIVPSSVEDQKAKLYLCSKYLETFTQMKEREKSFAELSIVLLVGMRDMLVTDPPVYCHLEDSLRCIDIIIIVLRCIDIIIIVVVVYGLEVYVEDFSLRLF